MRNPDAVRDDDMFAKHRKTARRTVINPAAISRRTPAARAEFTPALTDEFLQEAAPFTARIQSRERN